MKHFGLTHRVLTTSVLVALVVAVTKAQDQSNEVEWQRYLHIIRASTLEWSPSEPFLLKTEYQLYDLDGRPGEKGTAEESWAEPDGKRIRIHSPTLTVGDDTSANEFANHTRENYLVRQVINALVRPFAPPVDRKDFATDEFSQAIEGVNLACFALAEPGRPHAPDATAYCADEDNRVISMTGPLFVLQRTDFRKFLSHEIPMELQLSYEGKLALTMRVTELDPLPSHPAVNAKTTALPTRTRISAEVISANGLKKKEPKYPGVARAKHITGSVLITAIITKQGQIAGMDVIASPDQLLTKSAEDAVQSWTYRPYLLNGVPTEVETTITVNYAMGSK